MIDKSELEKKREWANNSKRVLEEMLNELEANNDMYNFRFEVDLYDSGTKIALMCQYGNFRHAEPYRILKAVTSYYQYEDIRKDLQRFKMIIAKKLIDVGQQIEKFYKGGDTHEETKTSTKASEET